MRFWQHALFFTLTFGIAAGGCDCGDDPGGTGTEDGGGNGADGSDGTDTGTNNDQDAGTGNDGGGSGDGSTNGDGGMMMGDAGIGDGGGDLEDPLSEFCTGEGTVVVVGGGGECAGEIAEETFQFGLCTCDTMTIQSQLTIDAFDSTMGPYDPAMRINDGHLGVNGELNAGGKVSIYGSSFVGGGGFSVGSDSLVVKTAFAAGTATQASASTSIGRNAFFDGNVVGRYNIDGNLYVPVTATVSQQTLNNLMGQLIRGPIRPNSPCPCGADEILDVGALTSWAAMHNDNHVENVVTATTWEAGEGPDDITLPCGRYYLTGIEHPRGLTIRAEGRTVLFVDGDMNIGGGLNLEIDQDAEIDLFVAGNVSVQAAARLGDPAYPSRVRTYVGGTEDIVFTASSEFGGNLYAPRADVYFEASATLYGALFANNVSFTGNALVHFDRAVRAAGDDCEEDPMPMDGGVPDGAVGMDGGGVPDGAVGMDAGMDDGGTPVDAGQDPDAGTPDTGPQGCMSCNECPSNLGCVIPPGDTMGTCTACVDDLDCCAPLSCISGVCMIDL